MYTFKNGHFCFGKPTKKWQSTTLIKASVGDRKRAKTGWKPWMEMYMKVWERRGGKCDRKRHGVKEKTRKRTEGREQWRVREQPERGGGCGFCSWLLLIFCKPQSASAISIHFLHLSLPFSSLPLGLAKTPSFHILLLLTLSITSSHPSLPLIYFPICWPASLLYSCCFITQHPHFLPLSYRHISALNYTFLHSWRKRRWGCEQDAWLDGWEEKRA